VLIGILNRIRGLPTWIVLALVLTGGGLVFVGMVMRAIEEEYGSGLNFLIHEVYATDTITVYEVDEQAGTRRVVFIGSSDEADAYMKDAQEARESFLVPNLIIGVGFLTLLVGTLSGILCIADRVFTRRRLLRPHGH
jgi:hypothetical protein